jgi:thiol-disulfide isomerase/thioredoxin
MVCYVRALRALALVAIASVASVGFAQAQADPDAVLRSLQAITNPADRQKAAAEAVKSIVPGDIAPARGLSWARVYSIARLYKRQKVAVSRFQRTNPTGEDAYQANLLLLDAGIGDRDAETALMAIQAARPTTNQKAYDLALRTATYNAYAIGLSNPDVGLEALRSAYGKVDLAQLSADDRRKLDVAYYGQAASLSASAGRFSLAATEAAAAAKLFPADSGEHRMYSGQSTLYGLVGKPAPNLIAESGTEGVDLAAHRGKVVLLDFYAHWCGPCIAAFPDLRQMASDLGPKGLQVVGVTRYYGYFGAERDISKDAEREKLKGFIGQHGLNWPTVIGTRENQEQYGIASIPTVVLIGRDGMVRHIKVGYSKDAFAAFRKEVEKALG